MVGNGGTGAIAILAPYLFVGSNVAVAIGVLATLHLMMQGRRLPQVPLTAREPGAT
jgi:tellurite resistance protein